MQRNRDIPTQGKKKKKEQLTERVNEMTLVGGHTRKRLQVN